jgi:hypothetical protein
VWDRCPRCKERISRKVLAMQKGFDECLFRPVIGGVLDLIAHLFPGTIGQIAFCAILAALGIGTSPAVPIFVEQVTVVVAGIPIWLRHVYRRP